MLNLFVLTETNGLSPISWVFFVIVFLAIAGILGYLGYLIGNKIYKDYLKKELTEDLISKYGSFVLDIKNNTFKYFNIKTGSEIKEDKIDLFLDSLDAQEIEAFKNWIKDLLTNNYKAGDKGLVALFNFRVTEKDSTHLKYKKHLFIVKKIVKKDQLVYLDVKCLNNIPLTNIDEINPKDVSKNCFTTFENFMSHYKKELLPNGGLVLVQLNKKYAEKKKGFNKEIIEARIIDAIFESVKTGTNIVFTINQNENSTQIYLGTTLFFNLYPLTKFVEELTKKLKVLFEISSYSKAFNFKIVAAKIDELPGEIEESMKLFSSIESMIEDEEKDYIIYQMNSEDNLISSYSYKGAIDNVFQYNLISMQYKPIINIHSEYTSLYGYIAKPQAKNSYFKSYDEFKRLVTKAFRDQERLEVESSLILNTITNELVNKKPKVIYEIEYRNIDSILSLFSQNIDIVKDKLILSFINLDLMEGDNIENVKSTITSLKNDGYNLALKLSINEHKLDESIYELFDSYLFDGSSITTKLTDHEFVLIRNLLERFVKYHKPLVLLNCSSWHIIELFIKIGITYFQSDLIAKAHNRLMNIDKKIEKKLINYMDK